MEVRAQEQIAGYPDISLSGCETIVMNQTKLPTRDQKVSQ
jgi:hypothetical protein